jgi:hypothetical protein
VKLYLWTNAAEIMSEDPLVYYISEPIWEHSLENAVKAGTESIRKGLNEGYELFVRIFTAEFEPTSEGLVTLLNLEKKSFGVKYGDEPVIESIAAKFIQAVDC